MNNNIVNLKAYRNKTLEQQAFEPWYKRFEEHYNQESRLTDLSDRTLYFLALPGEKSAVAFYEIIMGILDLGTAVKFYYLDQKEQMNIMDIHLFLADQVRFEVLRRLKWLAGFAGQRYSLFEMVQAFDQVKAACQKSPPELAAEHPDFAAYNQLPGLDREVFIRRLLPKALETYKKQLDL